MSNKQAKLSRTLPNKRASDSSGIQRPAFAPGVFVSDPLAIACHHASLPSARIKAPTWIIDS